MGDVLSKPLYFGSVHTPIQNEIHSDKQYAMNCHWWIKYGSVIIDPTPQEPPPKFAITGERLYFPFNKDDTKIRWNEMVRQRPYDDMTTEEFDRYLARLASTGDYKPRKCYRNALAKWRPLHPPYAPMGELVCGAVGYKVNMPENYEPHGGKSYVSLDVGW